MKRILWVVEVSPGEYVDWQPTEFVAFTRQGGRAGLVECKLHFPGVSYRLRRYQAVEGSR